MAVSCICLTSRARALRSDRIATDLNTRTMRPNLLQIPFQLLDDFPLALKLGEIIEKDFFQPVTCHDDLARAGSLHSMIASGARDSSLDFAHYRSALEEYFHLISDIRRKFPDHVIAFDWYGTLGRLPELQRAESWKPHMLHLIFQLGCVYNQMAFRENHMTDEGIKLTCQYYKVSAGCFDYLLQQGENHGFDPALLLALKLLNVAQAQELIWQKAVLSSGMKNSLVAKLSMEAANLYRQTAEAASGSRLIILEWINLFKVKLLHFEAASHYRMSITALDRFEYGTQVAYLKEALSLCQQAQKHKRYVDAKIISDLKGLETVVDETLKLAEKDNDLVYLKPVPLLNELPPIVGAAMVKPEPPQLLCEKTTNAQYFKDLYPYAIIQTAQAFRERLDDYLLKSFHEPVEALTRMFHSFLAQRDLPASINTIQQPEKIPDSIVQHAQDISRVGGLKILDASMEEISKLADNCRDLLFECDERMKIEQYEDELMIEREGAEKWTRPRSDVASASYLQRIDKMRLYLEQGHQSDVILGDMYKMLKPSLQVYCGGQQALSTAIPQSGHIAINNECAQLMRKLKDLLREGDELIESRKRFLASVEQKSRGRSALSLILKEFQLDPGRFSFADGQLNPALFEPIFERQVAQFNTEVKRLEQSKESQLKIEGMIDETNAMFKDGVLNSTNQVLRARQRALQDLENVYVRYLELVSDLNKASKFYVSFLEKGNAFLREVDDYLRDRREEARELALSIQSQRNFDAIAEARTNQPSPLVAPQGRRVNTWDPSKGIKFS